MTITVTQLNNYIRGVFDIDAVLAELSVCGEITNVKQSRDGWYFSLKDESASVNCFCYANCAEPVTGTVAVVDGKINYFVKSGSVSLFVRRLTATNNTGAAYLKFVELRDKLAKEGLFDEERKRPVPHSARRVGVVTSETGAVIHDIENVSLRRQPFTELILYPVKVQGVGADLEIAEGINYFSASDVDVVIVGRGGGSNEDLSVFNSEVVVRAIAACVKPVVSAVGHGIDFTLVDFAADKRAVTPSEAAEFVTLDTKREKTRVCANLDKIGSAIASLLQSYKDAIVRDAKLLRAEVGHKLTFQQNKVVNLLKRVDSSFRGKLDQRQLQLDKCVNRLQTLNPTNVLKRGYGYVSKNAAVVKTVTQVEVGDSIKLRLQDGSLDATVTAKEVDSK